VTGHIFTRRERELAAAHWLLAAASDAGRACAEWAEQGVALLRCGVLFAAVRIPETLVYAAAGTNAWQDVAGFLAEAPSGGPAFVHPRGGNYYALTAGSVARCWPYGDAVCLGGDTYLGVPATDRNAPTPAFDAYWAVPMGAPGTLCAAGDVAQLVSSGQATAGKKAAGDA
jgi:hypothetical protein